MPPESGRRQRNRINNNYMLSKARHFPLFVLNEVGATGSLGSNAVKGYSLTKVNVKTDRIRVLCYTHQIRAEMLRHEMN